MTTQSTKPGPWAIYPKVLATSTGEIERHAMIWFEDADIAKKFAAAESEHVGIEHEVYLASPPNVHFIEFRPGIMVKAEEATCRKAVGRLHYLSGVIEAMV